MIERDSRHVLITGDAGGKLHGLVDGLGRRGMEVTGPAHQGELPSRPVTALVFAEAFDAGMDWEQWWGEEAHLQRMFDAALPRLASASHGLLVGYSDTEGSAERAEIRHGMSTLIGEFQSHAGARRGIDFSMNGVEVPPGYDRMLLMRRLEEHVSRRSMLANRVVVPLERLRGSTIAQAITADII